MNVIPQLSQCVETEVIRVIDRINVRKQGEVHKTVMLIHQDFTEDIRVINEIVTGQNICYLFRFT